MDSLNLTALAATLTKAAKDVREGLPTGKFNLSGRVTFDVSGVLSVEEDTSYQPTTSIPLKVALALFIRYSGVTGPVAMNALVKAMTEALEINALPKKEQKAAIDAIREVADLEKAEKVVLGGLSQLPRQPRKGAVKADKVVVKVTEEEAVAELQRAEVFYPEANLF